MDTAALAQTEARLLLLLLMCFYSTRYVISVKPKIPGCMQHFHPVTERKFVLICLDWDDKPLPGAW